MVTYGVNSRWFNRAETQEEKRWDIPEKLYMYFTNFSANLATKPTAVETLIHVKIFVSILTTWLLRIFWNCLICLSEILVPCVLSYTSRHMYSQILVTYGYIFLPGTISRFCGCKGRSFLVPMSIFSFGLAISGASEMTYWGLEACERGANSFITLPLLK